MDEAAVEVFAVMLNLSCTPSQTIPTRFSPPESIITRPYLTARVNFQGTLDGACTVQCSKETAAELTATLTGRNPGDIPDTLCADTAGELCNMIAGSWKIRQHPEQAAYTLSCPTVKTIVSDAFHHPARRFRETVTLLYRVADHPITVNLAFI